MKKLLLMLAASLVLVFAVSYVALADSTLKVYYDLSGTVSAGGVSNSNDPGFSLNYEYTFNSDKYAWGIGVEWNFDRTAVGAGSGVTWIPIYVLGQVKLSDAAYLTGKIGLDAFIPDLSDPEVTNNPGLYLAAGFGYNISKNFVVEVDYSFLNGSMSDDFGDSASISYSKLSIGAGFKF